MSGGTKVVLAAGLLALGAGGVAVAGATATALAGEGGGAPAPASPAAVAAVPPSWLALYQAAASSCPGLPWAVLAAIGTVESANGTSELPGVRSGANAAGAEGPLQMLPATFAAYEEPVPPGGAAPPSPYDPADAAYAAARMLCADGGAGGRDLPGAVYAYNHDPAYVRRVLALAATYAAPAPAAVASTAVRWALAQVGTPYLWGGEAPGVGFDCSGLVQAAYAAAGLALPRVAEDQWAAGPALPPGAPLEPGDLVFFGAGPAAVDHVGIDVGTADGQAWMVDAPHGGADVRVEPFPDRVGASWGSEVVVGATRPGWSHPG